MVTKTCRQWTPLQEAFYYSLVVPCNADDRLYEACFNVLTYLVHLIVHTGCMI